MSYDSRQRVKADMYAAGLTINFYVVYVPGCISILLPRLTKECS